jgi:hypothetical protein
LCSSIPSGRRSDTGRRCRGTHTAWLVPRLRR